MIFNTNQETILNILLIEDDQIACNEIENYVDCCEDVTLTGITNNSTEALELVKQHLPDAVILDLELHLGGGNGLLFLLELSKLELPYRPYILVTTNNSSEITYASARELGADFIMAKHESTYSAKYVIDFLRMICPTILASRKTEPTLTKPEAPAVRQRKLTKRIQRELDLVGINRKNIGYQYLTDAILLIIENNNGNLVSQLAEKYQKCDSSVERAMEYAINRAWRTFPIEELEAHYTAKTHSCRGVPTVTEFIYYYADILKT